MNSRQLKRDLGVGSAALLVIANMVGTGIFTTSGFMMKALQNPWSLMLCWAVGGLFALCGALCYAELGARFPRAGGEYVFLRESLGRWPAFLSGWVSLIAGFSAPIGAAAVAFAAYFYEAFSVAAHPSRPLWEVPIVTISPVTITASAVIVALSLVHARGLVFGSRVQNGLTLFKVSLILVLITGAVLFGKGSWENLKSGFAFGLIFSEGFAVSLIFVSFAYSGWNASAYLGSEIRDPSFAIPFSLIGGTLAVTALYLLLNLVYVYALSPAEMSGVLEVGSRASAALFGQDFNRYFSAGIAFGILSLVSAMVMTGPRVYYAMARDGVFFRVLGKVSPRRGTPGKAILLQAGVAVAFVLTLSFERLLIYIGFTLSLFTALSVIGLMVLRSRETLAGVPYKTVAYPLTPILFVLGNLWIIFFSIRSRPLAAVLGAGTLVSGSIIFLFFRQKRSDSR